MEKPTPDALRWVRALSSGGAAALFGSMDPRREAIFATKSGDERGVNRVLC